MNKEIINTIIQSYEDISNLKGVSMNFSLELRKRLQNNGFIRDIGKYIISEDNPRGDIELSSNPKASSQELLIHMINILLKEDKLMLSFTNKATEKDKTYIEKLYKSINK